MDVVRVPNKRAVRSAIALVPSVIAFLLPLGKCPACWPAYAALLSSLGLGFLFYGQYLLPLTAVLAVGALSSLAYGARARHGYGPFSLALVGCLVAAAGKFLVLSPVLLGLGLGTFVCASGWNAWPRRLPSCDKCAPREDADWTTHERTL